MTYFFKLCFYVGKWSGYEVIGRGGWILRVNGNARGIGRLASLTHSLDSQLVMAQSVAWCLFGFKILSS